MYQGEPSVPPNCNAPSMTEMTVTPTIDHASQEVLNAPQRRMPNATAVAGNSHSIDAKVREGASEMGSQGKGTLSIAKPSAAAPRPGSSVQSAGGRGTS